VLLVAHDAVVLMLRHVLDRLDEEEMERVTRAGAVGNTSVTRWSRGADGRFELDCYNSAPHLD
jgi:probable phosphoglycerate mutase